MHALINHFTLYYQDEGRRNGIPLIFINALGCDLRIWAAIVASLDDKYRLIRYDLRGHGRSDSPSGPYTLRDLSNDLAALLAELKIDQAIPIGASIGGQIALEFALGHPSVIRALVLCNTAPQIGTVEYWSARILAVHERGLENMAESIIGRWFAPSFQESQPSVYNDILQMLSHNSQDGYAATCAALRDSELRSTQLFKLQIPVLALCGAQDVIVTPEQTREWANYLPNGKVDIIQGAAHLPCIEQPEVMSGLIRQFLQELNHAGG
jgi:3-oxoadipate enol-lactonase